MKPIPTRLLAVLLISALAGCGPKDNAPVATSAGAAGSGSAQAIAATGPLVLERTIEPTAGPGDVVVLVGRHDHCRYAGELVRDAVDGKSAVAGLIQAAGADGGAWHIDVSRRVCEQIQQPVKLRVDLPKPPSLAGGGGIPPAPYGYQSGEIFPVRTPN